MPALADTAVFPDTAIIGNSSNPNAILGAPDGTSSTFGAGNYGLFDYGTDITGQDITFYVTNMSGGTSWMFVVLFNSNTNSYVYPTGSLTNPNGNATSFFYVQVQNGAFAIPHSAFDTACAAAGGCTGVYIGRSVFSDSGATFALDSVGATPEPSAWALMVLGFSFIGWQLKQQRHVAPQNRAQAA